MELKHCIITDYDIKSIDKNDWKKADGITENAKLGTNSMLAQRDYTVKCYYPHKIGVYHGIHIWWCDRHHQPLFMCERDKLQVEILNLCDAVTKSDKTDSYEYGGKDAKNRQGIRPPQGTRWLTPRELARDFIRYIKG